VEGLRESARVTVPLRSNGVVPCSNETPAGSIRRMIGLARTPSPPPAIHCVASDERSSQTTAVPGEHMSFLLKSDLKKHLSTRAGSTTHHTEPQSTGDARVIMRDGNLITLPDAPVKDETVTTTVLD
jgi:hypothetical protein